MSPAPSTRAAAAAAADQATPLQVLVQHLPALPRPTQQQLLCQLLTTSAAATKLVQQHCTGKLSVNFSTYSLDRLKTFVPWLSKHGRLLSSLALELNLTNSCWHEAETAIGAALQKASASAAACGGGCGSGGGSWYSPPGLLLQSYCCHPAVAGPVLDQLDSWYLTRLELGRHAAYSCGFALEQLTRLVRLSLYEDSADALLPSLSPLTALTRVALVDMNVGSISKLKWLPPQLQELQLSLARLKRSEQLPPGLSLAHLTALTKLTNGDGKPLLLQAGDALPHSLKHLAVRDALDVTPLLTLSHLTHLSMCASTTPADQLKLLASSSSSSGSNDGSSGGLQAVSLCYGDMEAAVAAAGGWPLLPLDRLELRAAEGVLPAATLDTLGRLRRLRRLEVFGGGWHGFSAAAVFEVDQVQLAGALRQMTSLEVLGLRGFGLLTHHAQSAPPPAAPPAAAAAAAAGDEASEGSACTTYTEDMLCGHTSSLSLSSSYESTSNSSTGTAHNCTPHCPSSKQQHTSVPSSSSSSSNESLLPLLSAAAALPRLVCLTVSSVTSGGETLTVNPEAAAALAAASKLTSLQLSDLGLTNAAVNALVTHGLTHLRRLVVDNNPRVTAEVLPDDVITRLTALRELGVVRTGIRATAAGFKARVLRCHPQLQLKSSAR